MHIVSYDRSTWRTRLFPLTLTRPAGDLRVGILTIVEKWAKYFNADFSFLTSDHLREKFSLDSIESDSAYLVVRGNLCPDAALCDAVEALRQGEVLWSGVDFLAMKVSKSDFDDIDWDNLTQYKPVYFKYDVTLIERCEDIFLQNGRQIELDFAVLTQGRTSAALSTTNTIMGERIFAEEGVSVECAVLNSTRGPIYLGKESGIWEGAMVRGAFALCEGAQVKMGAKIYSNVTVGPYSRVGGELNTCVIWGNSAKGHEGYLGSAVVGEWCNWGADSNNSNLKNNYQSVRVYDYDNQNYRDTGLQFCGMVMGDHSKCAVNTTFNTGAVVGVGANIFGGGQLPGFIPDFSWGGVDGFTTYRLDKMLETAKIVFSHRHRSFDNVEERILAAVFEMTKQHRKF